MAEAINKHLFNEAKQYIPGGVNSPVRSFKAVGGYPVFIKRADGAKIYSEDGRKFIDYCMGFGALILGHRHPEVIKTLKGILEKGVLFGTPTKLETELAKLIVQAIPSIDEIRLTNSGTEAVMTAVRLARAYTKKDKIIKFAGAYHGHADYLLDCPGIPRDFIKHTLTCPYNDIKKVNALIAKYRKDIAAIIVEPIAGNMGVVLPTEDFLPQLRRITHKYNIVLIFDEVITGFRLRFGGAQELSGIKSDLTCLGKIIGGGLPISAVGGKREIMRLLAPEGEVYQAGTFSGNPLSVSAGTATLKVLSKKNPYRNLERVTHGFCLKIRESAGKYKIKLQINSTGSIFSIFFADREVIDYNIARTQDVNLFKKFYRGLLKEGIYLSPSGFEANFISTAHTAKDLEKTLRAIDKTFKNLKGG